MIPSDPARRLNRLLDAMGPSARYLEIGVETGSTFFQISARFKTAVDPKFLFDLKQAPQSEELEYFEMTSDIFFTEVKRDFKYDLVFLDGLHTWDQTYRDFCNALLITHDQSIIVIDDIYPSDVFSASRDQVEALLMRQYMTEDTSIFWHGDTYKVIPLISTFHTSLHFCTLTSGGNPQAIVWRSSDTTRQSPTLLPDPGYLNMPSLDYLWFLRNQDRFHPMDEQDGLNLAIQCLKRKQERSI